MIILMLDTFWENPVKAHRREKISTGFRAHIDGMTDSTRWSMYCLWGRFHSSLLVVVCMPQSPFCDSCLRTELGDKGERLCPQRTVHCRRARASCGRSRRSHGCCTWKRPPDQEIVALPAAALVLTPHRSSTPTLWIPGLHALLFSSL